MSAKGRPAAASLREAREILGYLSGCRHRYAVVERYAASGEILLWLSRDYDPATDFGQLDVRMSFRSFDAAIRAASKLGFRHVECRW